MRTSRTKLAFLFLAVLALTQCGKTEEGPGLPTTQGVVKIWVFGAAWCHSCEVLLPEINKGLKAQLTDPKSGLVGEVYVPTGKSPRKEPTQADADKYKADEKLDFVAKTDAPSWTLFDKEVGGAHSLPAAIVFSKDGTKKVFPPGTDFSSEVIVAYVKSELSK